jgi:predicted ATPase
VSELVGREAELRLADEALSTLRDATPPVHVVTGAPGLGKTRLVAELLSHAERRGYVALSGSGGELERDLPFGVVTEALTPTSERQTAASWKGSGRRPSTAWVPSCPRSGVRGPSRPRSCRSATARMSRRGKAAGTLGARRPLVVALDDLHSADPAPIELISYLLRHRPQAPVLMILALRRHPDAPRLRSVLEAAVRGGRVRWMERGPLSRENADQLVGEEVEPEHRESLYEQTGGNPFHLLALRRAATLSPVRV